MARPRRPVDGAGLSESGRPRVPPWWQTAVCYQVYPRSFADGNGDGIGDLPGLTARLDHLADLGIDAIWLSPHYPSPFLDCGYDITDFTAVDPAYGSLADFDAFLTAAHHRGIRVLVDFVLNHTSDQHPWFVAARSARDHPMRDWYVWRDPAPGGGPPNDWLSIMGGSAWTLDPATGQHYYHMFLPEQPDLNWRNPEVKAAMFGVARFWLDRGVDGFRLDAIGSMLEEATFAPHGVPIDPATFLDGNELGWDVFEAVYRHQYHQPGIHELLRELRAMVDAYPGDRVLVGEEENPAYHGTDDDELQLLFNFPLMWVDRLTPEHIRANQAERLAALPAGAWPCNTLGNHDNGRVRTRYGDRLHDEALARVHAALVLTLRGTPFLYQGEEIGMTDLVLSDPARLRDTAAIRRYRTLTGRMGIAPAAAMDEVAATTRDRCRSPFQWTPGPNAGFCPPGVEPWLPVNDDHRLGVDAESQATDSGSMLAWYRRLLAMRRATPALQTGSYEPVDPSGAADLAWWRRDPGGGDAVLVVLNTGPEWIPVIIPDAVEARVLLSTVDRAPRVHLDRLVLDPFEVLIASPLPDPAQSTA